MARQAYDRQQNNNIWWTAKQQQDNKQWNDKITREQDEMQQIIRHDKFKNNIAWWTQ